MRCLSFVIPVLICINISKLSAGQNCKTLNNWAEIAENEFPDLDFKSLISGSNTYNKIRYNLLSDKYFVPVFGEPYDQINEAKKVKIESSIRRCKDNQKYPNLESLNFIIWNSFTNKRVYEQAVEQVVQIRELRQEYHMTVQEIQSENVPFSNFNEYTKLPETKFQILFPSEIEYLSEIIKENKVRVANKELVARVNRMENLENNFSSLEPLNSFKINNYSLYQAAGQDVKERVDGIITNKIGEILKKVLTEEIVTLNNIENVSEINSFDNRFHKRFNFISNYDQVNKINTEIKTKKTVIVNRQFEIINEAIKDANTQSQLKNIEDEYLTNVLASNSTVRKLSDNINSRKKEIVLAEKRRLEEEERARQLAEVKVLEKLGFNFNTDGLYNEELVKNFFKGNFIDIPFNRDDMFFTGLLTNYMYTYANNCKSNLPDNKVQIYKDVCATERVTTNGWGVETDRYCIEWTEEPTGLFTSPELYSAYKTVKSISNTDNARNVWKLITQMTNDNSYNALGNMVSDAQSINFDIKRLIQMNGCDNKALKRFEANLIRFAKNEPPLKLDGTVETEKIDFSREQNFEKLVDDLIYENSKTWAANKYIRNSVENIRISKDSENRPVRISAYYSFNGFFGRKNYSVLVTFNNGIPDCLYFQDYPNTCRTADRKVIADFVRGKYVIE